MLALLEPRATLRSALVVVRRAWEALRALTARRLVSSSSADAGSSHGSREGASAPQSSTSSGITKEK